MNTSIILWATSGMEPDDAAIMMVDAKIYAGGVRMIWIFNAIDGFDGDSLNSVAKECN